MSMIAAGIGHDKLRIELPDINGTVANGTSVNVTATAQAVIVGGFPPFTHDWTENVSGVSMQASASVTSRLQATGTDTEHIGTLVYKLTQANGVVTTVSAAIDIIQGNPP